jgi:hypothetical protein
LRKSWIPVVRIPRPAEDADWLRKLIAACDKALEQTPTEDADGMALHADIITFRADLKARLDKLDAENAA